MSQQVRNVLGETWAQSQGGGLPQRQESRVGVRGSQSIINRGLRKQGVQPTKAALLEWEVTAKDAGSS